MIKIDITTLIFFYILFSVIIILIIWAISGYRRARNFPGRDNDSIWKCSVCFHVYVDSKHKDISNCPLCGSYNRKGEVKV